MISALLITALSFAPSAGAKPAPARAAGGAAADAKAERPVAARSRMSPLRGVAARTGPQTHKPQTGQTRKKGPRSQRGARQSGAKPHGAAAPFSFSVKSKREQKPLIIPLWSQKISRWPKLRPLTALNQAPLMARDLVIQGDGFFGLKAFHKETGNVVWSQPIAGGVSGGLALFERRIYFGSQDGFFGAADMRTGQILWRFFAGSVNLSRPLIQNGAVFWQTSSPKNLRALSQRQAFVDFSRALPALVNERGAL